MEPTCPRDPFHLARESSAVLPTESAGEPILMLLRHKDVMAAAKDWENFSSDAPFRVPIPSEESMRSVRQLPIETDPPEHTGYRKWIEPTFKKPLQPGFAAEIEQLVATMLDDALAQPSIEIVREFSLPLQSRALARLLNVPPDEAERWISWGVHVFHDGPDGAEKGGELDRYIRARFDQAEQSPGDDFFSELCRADPSGKTLSRDERVGFANLVFAGGRDTVIHTVSHIIAWFAENPHALENLRQNPRWIATAAEEFVRVVTPLTQIGRVCPVDTSVHGHPLKADQRISLCWASANQDPSVFESPEELRLDRRPNPHLAYGSGIHHCIGAPHARLIIKTLLRQLCARVSSIELIRAEPNIETAPSHSRQIGYHALTVRFLA